MTRKVRGIIKDSKYPPKDKYVLWLKDSTIYQFKGDDWYPLSTNSDVLEIMEDFNKRIEDYLKKIRRDTETAKELLTEVQDKNNIVENVSTTIDSIVNKANTAVSNAQSAINNANSATQTAQTAINNLNNTVQQAQNAVNTANQATQSANDAVSRVNTAISNANIAADNANQAAGQFEGQLNTLQTAVEGTRTDLNSAVETINTLSSNVYDNTTMIQVLNEDTEHIAYKDRENTFSQPQTFSENVSIAGDLILKGETFVQDAEHVKTADDYITLRDGAVAGLAANHYAGISVTKYNGTTDGVMQIGSDGTMRIGDVNDTQPILTRAESNQFRDGDILKWDATNLKAVPLKVTQVNMEVTFENSTSTTYKIICIV